MIQDSFQGENTNREQALAKLERQVERGSLFTHTIVSRNADRIHEAESFLYGIIDVFIEKGIVRQDEVLRAAGKVRQEMVDKGQTQDPGIALRMDGRDNEKDDFIPVNCAERLHVCKAVCCRLHFALTAQEVESANIKWDLGAPYYIRQESTGCCTHLDQNTKSCFIYENRPGVCRQYSCARDERVWKDFENMVLNEEWIIGHLGDSKPRLVAAQMLPQSVAFQHSEE